MGCICSKQVKPHRERTISVANHMVALTSTTLGVLELGSTSPRYRHQEKAERERDNDKQKGKQLSASINFTDPTTEVLQDVRKDLGVMNNNCWVEKTVIEEEKKALELDPVTINAWELMEGLDEDLGESPAKRKSAEKDKNQKTSPFHTIEMDDARKENSSPVAFLGNGNDNASFLRSGKQKMKEVSSPLRELNVDSFKCYKSSPLKTPDNYPRRVSDGSMTDLKVAPTRRLNSRFRLSIDLITEPDSPLFSPGLVASLEKALENLSEEEWNAIKKAEGEGGLHRGSFPAKILNQKKKTKQDWKDPLENFEQKCPPGGANAVVLYTTTLRGIRKTFEQCNNVRDALESYGICISERDVSMHLEFRNELRRLMGKLVTVPRLFIKGRYIGGADDLLRIHEEGKLGELLQGIPTQMAGKICDGCGGVRFVPCLECSGSCKLVNEENMVVRCPECNENGLIQCPICC